MLSENICLLTNYASYDRNITAQNLAKLSILSYTDINAVTEGGEEWKLFIQVFQQQNVVKRARVAMYY